MSKPLAIAYSDQYLDWQLGAGFGSHPTNPVSSSEGYSKQAWSNPNIEEIKDSGHPHKNPNRS